MKFIRCASTRRLVKKLRNEKFQCPKHGEVDMDHIEVVDNDVIFSPEEMELFRLSLTYFIESEKPAEKFKSDAKDLRYIIEDKQVEYGYDKGSLHDEFKTKDNILD